MLCTDSSFVLQLMQMFKYEKIRLSTRWCMHEKYINVCLSSRLSVSDDKIHISFFTTSPITIFSFFLRVVVVCTYTLWLFWWPTYLHIYFSVQFTARLLLYIFYLSLYIALTPWYMCPLFYMHLWVVVYSLLTCQLVLLCFLY